MIRQAVGNFHGVNRQSGFRHGFDGSDDFVGGETLRLWVDLFLAFGSMTSELW